MLVSTDRDRRELEIARGIAAHLVTNGAGQIGTRLKIVDDVHPTRELGGWSREALAGVIREYLRRNREALR